MSRIFHRSYDERHEIERRNQEPSSNSRAQPPVRPSLSPPHPSRPVRRSLKERSHVLRGALPCHVHLMYSEMDRLYLRLFSWAPSSRDFMGYKLSFRGPREGCQTEYRLLYPQVVTP